MKKRKPDKREIRRATNKAFRLTFAVTLLAMRDLYPEVDIDMKQLTARIKSMLNEFNTIGYEEINVLCAVVQEEFEIDLRKL